MAAEDPERIEWSRPADLPGVDLLFAEQSTRPWRVYHETYTVATLFDVSGGDIEWTYRKKRYRAGAGEVALMQPGEVHANTRAHRPCNFRVLFIPSGIVEQATADLEISRLQPSWKLAHSPDPTLFRNLVRLHASLEAPASELERQSRFAACLRLLLERCAESSSSSFNEFERASLLRARDFIRQHYARPIALAELAAVSGLSRFHLVRAFAKAFGLPPHAYQNRVQIANARDLLATGCPPIDVAAETGYADQSHFTRHFKAIYGVTPGEYRRACGLDRARRGKNVLAGSSMRS